MSAVRPVRIEKSFRCAASGCRIRGNSSGSAPSADGFQSAMLMPFGTYRNAIRFGTVFAPGVAASAQARNGPMASSQGSANAVPMPRNRVRRESLIGVFMVFSDFLL